MFESKEIKELAQKLETQITESWDNWETDKKEQFENIEFINSIIEWRSQHNPKSLMGKLKKPNEYLHFGREIIDDFSTKKLAKLVDSEEDSCLSKVDFETEIPLWFHWWDNGFLLTNKAMYCTFFGEKLLDAHSRNYVKPLDSIENIEYGWSIAHSTIKINGETMGTWAVENKKFLKRVCEAICGRTKELIKQPETAGAQNASTESNLDKLRKLKELLDVGAINQEDFDKKKAELLSNI